MSAAGSRAAWLSAKHDNQVRDLRQQENSQKRQATSQLQQTMGRRYKSARQDFALERSALIGRQRSEKVDLRERWRLRNEQKRKAIEGLEVTGRIAAKDEELVQDGDKITAKRKFKERTAEREGRSRGRSRKRKRE